MLPSFCGGTCCDCGCSAKKMGFSGVQVLNTITELLQQSVRAGVSWRLFPLCGRPDCSPVLSIFGSMSALIGMHRPMP